MFSKYQKIDKNTGTVAVGFVDWKVCFGIPLFFLPFFTLSLAKMWSKFAKTAGNGFFVGKKFFAKISISGVRALSPLYQDYIGKKGNFTRKIRKNFGFSIDRKKSWCYYIIGTSV